MYVVEALSTCGIQRTIELSKNTLVLTKNRSKRRTTHGIHFDNSRLRERKNRVVDETLRACQVPEKRCLDCLIPELSNIEFARVQGQSQKTSAAHRVVRAVCHSRTRARLGSRGRYHLSNCTVAYAQHGARSHHAQKKGVTPHFPQNARAEDRCK